MVGKSHPSFQRARKPEHRLERRDALLDAAAKLFQTLELSELTLAAVGARAGVSKATVYGYFETKESLLLAVLEREFDAFFTQLDAALARLEKKRPTPATIADLLAC